VSEEWLGSYDCEEEIDRLRAERDLARDCAVALEQRVARLEEVIRVELTECYDRGYRISGAVLRAVLDEDTP
jgi:hypothetical protein